MLLSLTTPTSLSSKVEDGANSEGKEREVEGANIAGLKLRNPFRRKPFFPLLASFFSLLVVHAENFKGGAVESSLEIGSAIEALLHKPPDFFEACMESASSPSVWRRRYLGCFLLWQ
jgi:hypothetical protein